MVKITENYRKYRSKIWKVLIKNYRDQRSKCIEHTSKSIPNPIGRNCKIHRLHLSRTVTITPNECCRYNTKQSNGEALVILERWGMLSTQFIAIALRSTQARTSTPERALSMGQVELFDT